MDINNLLNSFNSALIANFLIKFFFVILSLLYLFYSVVIYKQIQMMNQVLEDRFKNLIIFVSLVQISIALILFIFVIFLI
ncbi:MAG: DUF5657 family protein [Microgenomates group bacterium]